LKPAKEETRARGAEARRAASAPGGGTPGEGRTEKAAREAQAAPAPKGNPKREENGE